MYWLLQVPFSFQILEWTCSKSFVACVASAKGENQGGRGTKKYEEKRKRGDWGLGTGEERREGSACSHAIVFFIYAFAGERKNPIG